MPIVQRTKYQMKLIYVPHIIGQRILIIFKYTQKPLPKSLQNFVRKIVICDMIPN